MKPHPLPLRRTVLAAALLGALAAPAFSAPGQNSDGPTANRQTQDTGYALVQLNGDPLSTYVKTKPAQGKKIDFSSNTVKAYRAQLNQLRNDYKAWLRANVPGAKVTGEFDISLNAVSVQLNGATLAQVSASSMVKTAQYENLYYPAATDPDLALISAPAAWAGNGGQANAGEGIKVAIIDTGVDVTHPCFSDAGYPARPQLGDTHFTNNKVIVAKVFNNKTPSMRYTAEAIGAHGSHVAGTVACNANTAATVDGSPIPYGISGVAPRALLGSYNIFPNDIENARSEDILNALESAYADGMDVANMSIGGGSHGIQDLVTVAVDNLDRANLVIAIANGNSGPGYRTVESPGMAARALSAGASSVGHQMVSMLTVGASQYESVKGEFGTPPAGGLTAPLAVVADAASPFGGLSDACNPIASVSLSGKVALVSRGNCFFSVKLRNVQAAGGVGAIVVNNAPGAPITMGTDGLPSQPTIPGFMTGLENRAALMASDGQSATLPQLTTYVFHASGNDILADFSSWGPTDVDFRVKPDVMAPGVNVLSSIPTRYCGGAPCFAFFQGTSMATPHLAGSAAIVRQQHPTWSAAQVRSAIVNTADQGVVKTPTGTVVRDVNVIGAGRENLLSAVNAQVTLDPVSVSFGAVPSGSGQARQMTVTLTNVSGGSQTFSLAVDSALGSGVSFSVWPSSVTLAPGASATATVTMTEAQGAAAGNKQAMLRVSAGGAEVAHGALFTLVK
jgi:subtilisin family serine protease